MLRLIAWRHHEASAIGTSPTNAHPAALVTVQQSLTTLVAIAGIVVDLFFASRTNYHITIFDLLIYYLLIEISSGKMSW
jgi:hypothetical protein